MHIPPVANINTSPIALHYARVHVCELGKRSKRAFIFFFPTVLSSSDTNQEPSEKYDAVLWTCCNCAMGSDVNYSAYVQCVFLLEIGVT